MSQEAQLAKFAELVRACPHNLMSKRDLTLIEERHIPECLEVARRLPRCEKVADLGSGGGFPGIVIAIARPDLEVHLIESIRKKAEFLFDTAEELSLRVQVHHARAEELGAGPLRGQFPIVTARAVARLDQLTTWAVPLLDKKGELWAMKGDQWAQEVREARLLFRKLHCSIVESPDSGVWGDEVPVRMVRVARH